MRTGVETLPIMISVGNISVGLSGPDLMKQKEKDEQFAAHLPGVLQYHQNMLADGVRNKLLYKAIKRSVTPETSFLDIGAGTGVWAILAAKLGAKRVVAVEVEEGLIPIIYKLAQENGVASRIEIVHGKSDDVKIRGKFDVIVSELFDSDAFGAGTVKSFVDLRTRFLAPGGVLIPQKLEFLAVPAFVETSVHEVPAGIDLKCDFFRSIKLNYAQSLAFSEHDRVKFLAEPSSLLTLDFSTVTESQNIMDVAASWTLKNISRANAIVTFNHSTFADGIAMEGFGSQSWGAGFYAFDPFPK